MMGPSSGRGRGAWEAALARPSISSCELSCGPVMLFKQSINVMWACERSMEDVEHDAASNSET